MARPNEMVYEFDMKDRGPLNFVEIGFHDFSANKHYGDFLWVQETYTLHFVRNGRGILTFNGKTYQLNTGDLFFLPPGEPHHYSYDKNDPWCYFWFSIIHDSARDMGKAMGFSKDNPVIKAKSPQTIMHLLDELFNCDVPITTRYYMALSSFMQIVVSTLPKNNEEVDALPNDDVVFRAKEIISLNYKNPLFTVDAIPELLNISHTHLCRLFKSRTGMTLIKYLIDVRLTHAAVLLHEKAFSVRELADAVGFSDERNFTRHFKKKFGKTVMEYKKDIV